VIEKLLVSGFPCKKSSLIFADPDAFVVQELDAMLIEDAGDTCQRLFLWLAG
jgi:hypothetical protein